MKTVAKIATTLGLVGMMAIPAVAGDAAKGKKIWNRCKACHTLEAGKNRVGPSLSGVIGRAAGAVEGYKYSAAMKDSGVVWNDENLTAFLTKPKTFIAKNKMTFPGLRKPAQIADVIAYIKENSK